MGTSKERYIELHGEEEWIKEAERRSNRFKKWRDNNTERKIQYDKNYYELNKEHINELARINGKKYRTNNRKKLAKKANNYRKTESGKASCLSVNYKKCDKKRGLDISNNITQQWIIDNIFSGQSCVYCGDNDWTHLGADRIDNSKPHTPENVVCACFICNSDRSDNYSVEEFKKYRALHPRACDVPKGPTILLSETGALKKRAIN